MFGCSNKKDTPSAERSPKERLLARADSLALDTVYTVPPGDALSHYTAGYAKIMCSAVFITGLDPDFAAANVGYFTSPPEQRAKVEKPVIDRVNKRVSVKMPNGIIRTAVYTGSQGCVTLSEGSDQLSFEPKPVKPAPGNSAQQDWPMGERLSGQLPSEVNKSLVDSALQAAFGDPEGMTAAFVVTWKGKLIGERYGEGITATTPLESWSMGKSLTATLMGILINDGAYSLDQSAPIPEWQQAGDPRQEIRIRDILNMSSGLMCRAPQDPDFDPTLGYPAHWYLYTGGVNSFQYAASLKQQWKPGQVGRYRNSDPVLTNYLVRLAAEKSGDYHSFPQRRLFDKLGIRTMVMETDPFGNFLTQGYEFASARDWARLGNLYLQDGVWNGERILPEGYAEFVSTLAPAWKADERPIYGGFFWLNGNGEYPVPTEAYFMAGAGGQYTFIIPSHDLVIVRLGHYKGAGPGEEALKKAMGILARAVPARQ
ncbi:MAG: serine hydrolase domain-containing protein [Bacteroidota bacterium]